MRHAPDNSIAPPLDEHRVWQPGRRIQRLFYSWFVGHQSGIRELREHLEVSDVDRGIETICADQWRSLYIVYLFIAKFALTYFSMVGTPPPYTMKKHS